MKVKANIEISDIVKTLNPREAHELLGELLKANKNYWIENQDHFGRETKKYIKKIIKVYVEMYNRYEILDSLAHTANVLVF